MKVSIFHQSAAHDGLSASLTLLKDFANEDIDNGETSEDDEEDDGADFHFLEVVLDSLTIARARVVSMVIDNRRDDHKHKAAAERVDAAQDGEALEAAGLGPAEQFLHFV